MSLIKDLPVPLDTIVIENEAGSYKDFEAGGAYPIEGVNFHADYGYLPGYTGEDGHELDFFVGSDLDGKNGYFLVWRSDKVPKEHKYFVAMSEQELAKTLEEYQKVLVDEEVYLPDRSSVVSSAVEFRNGNDEG